MNAELQQIVDAARAANACAPGMEEIVKFDTVEQALASKHGPLMAALYAMKTMKARWPKAEAAIKTDKFAWAAYCTAFGIK